jgi:predicted acetyltransferase
MKIEIRYPKKDEMPELFALLKTCFPTDKKIFEVMEKEDLSFGYEPKILSVDGKIVSNVSLVKRDIYIGSKLLKGGGIAGVATHPDYRRKGYAKMLLKERFRDISLKGLDFSPLFTDKPFIYEKLGWKIFPQKFYILGEIKIPLNVRKKSVEMFHCSTKVLMEEVKRIYEQNILFFPGALKRDKAYWQECFRIFDLKDKELFFLLREGSTTKAYARVCKEKDNILLGEMGVKKEDNQAIKGLFYYLLWRTSG